MLKEVEIFRYVTKGTFDAYNWSIIETKQKFISQVMSGSAVGRECEDVDEAVLNYAEMKAISSDNPLIKEKMELDMEVQKLKVLRDMHIRTKHDVEQRLKRDLPNRMESLKVMLNETKEDIKIRDAYKDSLSKDAKIPYIINGNSYESREEAGAAFTEGIKNLKTGERIMVGNYCGFEFGVKKEYALTEVLIKLILKGCGTYNLDAGESAGGNLQRIANMVEKLDSTKENLKEKIEHCKHEMVQLKAEYEKSFEREEEYTMKLLRQKELEVLLSGDNKDDPEPDVAKTKNKGR